MVSGFDFGTSASVTDKSLYTAKTKQFSQLS